MKVFETSKSKFAQSRNYLAGGVASSLRASMKPVPLYAASGKGSHIRDVDGNEYVDYMLAYGPLILGHAHDGLTESILEAMRKGYTYGVQHQGEIELAQLLCEVLPCADKVSLSGSGTEAVMLALRLARAHTGRSKVIRFHGHYHGWSDAIFTSFPSADMKGHAANNDSAVSPGTNGQSANSLSDVILLPWNDKAALESTLRTRHFEIAAVITEPVMCNSGCILPEDGYLELIRDLTKELGIVMIMDEVITGFRLGIGGAQERFGITPDLVTVGKALGGGIAISAVGGREAIMKLVDDGVVSHLGTLNGNGVSTAAAIATIRELRKNNGAAFAHMEGLTGTLVEGIRSLFKQHEVPGIVNQIGPVFNVMFTEEAEVRDFAAYNRRDSAKYARFAELMLDEGVLVRPNGLWYMSTAHGEADIEKTLSAIDNVLLKLK
ncbi:aspartate aminotransferase family protein [Cohnella silvisoli]|uniref:Aspartate aminotransferase family protein n=1 Tax=Cohnella silvisoli TaxID=2873699 RepID=A0ABV1L3A5_9BACL|nr:aspartate aminotransferase family protein [Cohnella silvisoli]MCD9021588.1 aspartate aminotransferase family protein [Cohnella silvisoli]